MYEIETRNDLNKGATLVVSVPESTVDKKALYTLLSDTPSFILPFTYRSIDGMCEFTYQVGTRSKMAYFAGSRTPTEYADMWFDLLKPLLDCGDWFMKPFSFVLRYDYLYCDKNGKSIGYVYIPTLSDYSSYDDLKRIGQDMANKNRTSDAVLENDILRAIQDFKTQEILDIVNRYKSGARKAAGVQIHQTPQVHVPSVDHVDKPNQSSNVKPLSSDTPPIVQPNPEIGNSLTPPQRSAGVDGIKINLQSSKKAVKEKPAKHSEPQKTEKEKKGFFDRFRKPQQEEIIMQGAAISTHEKVAHEPMPIQPIYQNNVVDSVTELDDVDIMSTPKFRYVGAAGHPPTIEISLQDGAVFTIGRFDASVGSQQSNFEFDMRTKAVSRRHAAIEKHMDGYYLVDLNSSGGTFVNGQRLTPNAPVKLERGSRVSFGYSGADYMWEE